MAATAHPDELYGLLPADLRLIDSEQGGPLRELLALIQREADLVRGSIEDSWDDRFIETCADWVIPYIGDLVSNRTLYDARRAGGQDTATAVMTDLQGAAPGGTLRPPVALDARSDVAKTISYRRRKGTPAMLEELARDVTGWPAHLVELFELCGWTQHREHVRPQGALPDLRAPERCDRIGGAFDEAVRCPDVRVVAQDEGRPELRGVAIFLWRIAALPLVDVPAPPVTGMPAWRRHASPLGADQPLFCHRRREEDEAARATELDVPAPIRPSLWHADLVRHAALPAPPLDHTELYGMFTGVRNVAAEPFGDASLFLLHDRAPVHAAEVVCRRLDPWPAARPTGLVIGVDVTNGRLALGTGFDETKAVDVLLHHGAAAELGGGTYDRRRWLVRERAGLQRLRVKADNTVDAGAPPPTHTSVADALTTWASLAFDREDCVIEILDSRTYDLPAAIALRNDRELVLEAADGERPLLRCEPGGLTVDVDAPPPGATERDGALTLSGVIVTGNVTVTGDLGLLRLLHATLVPGRGLVDGPNPGDAAQPAALLPSIEVAGTDGAGAVINRKLELQLAFSVCGPILAGDQCAGILALDSIVDGLEVDPAAGLAIGAAAPAVGPPLDLERSTVLGAARALRLSASETVIAGTAFAQRTQEGCVRFSYMGPDSRTPRRFRCQPDLVVRDALATALARDPTMSQADQDALKVEVRGGVVAQWHERRYGRPAYGQLRLSCPQGIRTGAQDGSEMGALCHVKQPQREANLRLRLDEYLPFGLDAGPVYLT